ncbi:MAG: sensor kinase [Conexibacter sp.]|nr:sensor kinase [Conexibacter sp.]
MTEADLGRDLHRVAEEQDAIGHVADLVASDATPDEILDEVVAQASQLTGVEFTTLLRFEAGGGTQIAALSGAPEGLAVGMREPGDGQGATQRVLRTGRAARMDDLSQATGHWPRVAYSLGFASSAAAPIVIGGRLWGTLVVTGRNGPLPAGVEESLTRFAKLAGTAIADAQARRRLRALLDEQAALRRVAELAARAGDPVEVFAAVAIEASALVDGEEVFLLRLAGPDTCQILATTSDMPLSDKLYPLEDGDISVLVRDTRRPARIDDAVARDCAMAREWGVVAVVGAPVIVREEIWGALTATSRDRPLPPETERRLSQFADLVAVSIGNAESRAQLTASRARVVATADETRLRLQRDVHDGAQQRLVQTVLTLKMALAEVGDVDGRLRSLLEDSLRHAERASTELRDVVHGILPASLRTGGLRSAIESLTADLPLPVDSRVATPRFEAQVETTAYFIVAEALTNVVKHARAKEAEVEITFDATSSTLAIVIQDDGIGGADPGRGSGLLGLSDRVAARDGELAILSPAGRGTRLQVALPATPAGSQT